MTTKAKRVLPADVYDALELSALAYGGIGAGDTRDRAGAPLCLYGHIYFVGDGDFTDATSEIVDAVRRCQGGMWIAAANDDAVFAIAGRDDVRVSWEQYVTARGWERGR